MQDRSEGLSSSKGAELVVNRIERLPEPVRLFLKGRRIELSKPLKARKREGMLLPATLIGGPIPMAGREDSGINQKGHPCGRPFC
jgi:hypothetical protein